MSRSVSFYGDDCERENRVYSMFIKCDNVRITFYDNRDNLADNNVERKTKC